jgi:hypothetical protein
MTDQPWRGIIDAGVVLGLTWGMVSIVLFAAVAFGTGRFDYPPDLPEQKSRVTGNGTAAQRVANSK